MQITYPSCFVMWLARRKSLLWQQRRAINDPRVTWKRGTKWWDIIGDYVGSPHGVEGVYAKTPFHSLLFYPNPSSIPMLFLWFTAPDTQIQFFQFPFYPFRLKLTSYLTIRCYLLWMNIDRLIDWLIDWLIDRSIDRSINLVNRSIDQSIWSIDLVKWNPINHIIWAFLGFSCPMN